MDYMSEASPLINVSGLGGDEWKPAGARTIGKRFLNGSAKLQFLVKLNARISGKS